MASSFTWLDYSENDRKIVLDILEAFKEHEARDELGIGVVRDAFSDMLFPGTSTIQTRAKYFLFVPWLYRSLEEKKVPSSKIEGRARKEEILLIKALLASDDTDGIIGKEAKENLQRLPSNIYWQGLDAWGIRLFPYSISDYHRSLDTFYKLGKDSSHSFEEESDRLEKRRNWHPELPLAPDDFPYKNASFRLTYDEASYLKERVLSRCPNTMLACLLATDMPSESVQFPWEHPICHDLSEPVREKILHARNFSETIYGAAILYNLMLAEKAGAEELSLNYQYDLIKLADRLQSRINELIQWDKNKRFWNIIFEQGARPTGNTQRFILEWLQIALSPGRAGMIAKDDYARDLIRKREIHLKGELAKLKNPEALDRWRRDASTRMAGQLRYRWRPAEKNISDIRTGLRRS